MLLGELVPVGGGDPIPLLKDKLQIGRRSSCDIVLQFPNVSSHHSELELIDGFWLITDLSSRNGTKVNGVRVRRKWAVPGDHVGFAKHKFEIVYTPEGDAPPELPGIDGTDGFSQSLMEKAGLVRRKSEMPPQPPKRLPKLPPEPSEPPLPVPEMPVPEMPVPENREIAFAAQSDSDEVIQWLTEGDDD